MLVYLPISRLLEKKGLRAHNYPYTHVLFVGPSVLLAVQGLYSHAADINRDMH